MLLTTANPQVLRQLGRRGPHAQPSFLGNANDVNLLILARNPARLTT